MKLKIKKLIQEAVIPTKAHESDAGFDLTATTEPIFGNGYIQYGTGLAIQTEQGYHTELFPRGSVTKYDLILKNSIGLVDEAYRGELMVRFWPTKAEYPNVYKKGDKIAQLVVRKTEHHEIEVVEELDQTDRGEGRFGSSDKK